MQAFEMTKMGGEEVATLTPEEEARMIQQLGGPVGEPLFEVENHKTENMRILLMHLFYGPARKNMVLDFENGIIEFSLTQRIKRVLIPHYFKVVGEIIDGTPITSFVKFTNVMHGPKFPEQGVKIEGVYMNELGTRICLKTTPITDEHEIVPEVTAVEETVEKQPTKPVLHSAKKKRLLIKAKKKARK